MLLHLDMDSMNTGMTRPRAMKQVGGTQPVASAVMYIRSRCKPAWHPVRGQQVEAEAAVHAWKGAAGLVQRDNAAGQAAGSIIQQEAHLPVGIYGGPDAKAMPACAALH